MPFAPEVCDLLALQLVPGLGPRLTAALLERFGSPAAAAGLQVNDVIEKTRPINSSENTLFPLLAFLFRHQTRPELTCRFRWQVGSLAFWDNRSSQHYAVSDYWPAVRRMERVTIVGDRPVWLERVDGHAGWANSAAMREAKVDARTPTPSGGRNETLAGKPTGIFVDAAKELIARVIPPPLPRVRDQAFEKAQEIMSRYRNTLRALAK